MATFDGQLIDLDKPIYVLCGSHNRKLQSWFPVTNRQAFSVHKAFLGRIGEVSFSQPGIIRKMTIFCNALPFEVNVSADDGAFLGKTPQEARKLFENRR